jgi:hypothetical protein
LFSLSDIYKVLTHALRLILLFVSALTYLEPKLFFVIYFITVTNQNLIEEEIKRRLNSGNACYHSVQNLLPSRLLSKNLKIRIYKIVILPVDLNGFET